MMCFERIAEPLGKRKKHMKHSEGEQIGESNDGTGST
jgi:hypothetical protein